MGNSSDLIIPPIPRIIRFCDDSVMGCKLNVRQYVWCRGMLITEGLFVQYQFFNHKIILLQHRNYYICGSYWWVCGTQGQSHVELPTLKSATQSLLLLVKHWIWRCRLRVVRIARNRHHRFVVHFHHGINPLHISRCGSPQQKSSWIFLPFHEIVMEWDPRRRQRSLSHHASMKGIFFFVENPVACFW